MDFNLSAAHAELQQRTRSFIEEQIIPMERDPRCTPHGPTDELRLEMVAKARKVGLVAALASGAKVTLLDQPFVSLDQASIRVFKEILTNLGRDPQRAYLIADYEKPADMPLAAVLALQAQEACRPDDMG
jgi:hypothetical protein